MFDATRIKHSTNIELVEIHRQLDSTNNRALELLRNQNVTPPALIVAEHQTAGRGQRDRQWWSGPGSLTFSWIAPTADHTGQTETANRLLPIAAAIAVADAIESQTKLDRIKIKWPNDLMVSGRKISGILIESVSIGSTTSIVVGIGINVNNENLTPPQIGLPDERSRRVAGPTSVLDETHRWTPLEDLLISTVRRLECEFELACTDPESIASRCNTRLAFIGQTINVFLRPGKYAQGKCQGIGTDGGLVLKSEDGLITIYSGTIAPL